MKKNKLFYIGLTAVISALILVFGIEFLKGINLFHPSNYYFVTLEKVEGLSISAPVTTNGFKVGQVREMNYQFDNPGHISVELALDPKLIIPEGTEAELATDLLGTASINLIIPTSGTPLPKGTTIPSRSSAGLIDGLKDDVMPALGDIMPKIDSLLCALTAVVADPSIALTLQRLDKISADLNVLSSNLAVASATFPQLTNQATSAMTNIDRISVNLDSLSTSLNNLPLETTMANIESLSADLKEVGNQLHDPSSSLGMLIYDPSLYRNINNTVASLDSLVIDVKAHPKRYLKFSVF